MLYERLQLLTTGIAPATPIVEVVRAKRSPDWTPKHLQIVMRYGNATRNEEHDRPGNPPGIAWIQTFEIDCHCIPSEKDPTPFDEQCAVMAADVQDIVTQEDYWHDFNGLAYDAEFDDPEELEGGDESPTGVRLKLNVMFRVSERSNYVNRI